jgi:hypothetical protein
MRAAPRSGFRRIGILATAFGLAAAYACSDLTGTNAPRSSTKTSDFVASGTIYNTLWRRDTSGLVFSGGMAMPLMLSRTAGAIKASSAAGVQISRDTAPARALFEEMTANRTLGRNASAARQSDAAASRVFIPRAILRAKTVVKRKVDGKEIRVAFVPDDDKSSGRPPKASMVLADGRIASVTEFVYGKRSGAWRALKTRTTTFDDKGRALLVEDSDLSGLNYAMAATSVGSATASPNRASKVLLAVSRLFRPDELFAAGVEDDDESRCWYEALQVALTAAAVVGAEANLAAAEASLLAARLALDAAFASCIESPETCLAAIAIASASVAAAESWVTSGWIGVSTAVAAASAATVALGVCLFPPKKPDEVQTGPSGGGGGGEGGGDCEEWCQWTITFDWDGNVESITTDYCWCEYAT